MNLLWFVLWLLSSGALFLSSVFVPPATLWGAGMITAGIVLGAQAIKKGKRFNKIAEFPVHVQRAQTIKKEGAHVNKSLV